MAKMLITTHETESINILNFHDPSQPIGKTVDIKLAYHAPELLKALKTVVSMEYDRDEESRNFEDERLEYWQQLINQTTGE